MYVSTSPAASPSLALMQLRALGLSCSSFLGIRHSWHQALPGCANVLTLMSLPLRTCLHKCRYEWWWQYYMNQAGCFCRAWQEANSQTLMQKGRCWVFGVRVVGKHNFWTSRDSHSITRIAFMSPFSFLSPLPLPSFSTDQLALSLLSSPFGKEGFFTPMALTKLRFHDPFLD